MNIRLIRHADIDKVRYNSAVHFAPNGNIFGYKWYLDAMAREFDVLVENEYESVMPLPYRDLVAGRKALYQPALVRELAIYSVNILSAKRINAFWEAIPETYKLIDLQMEPRSRPRAESDLEVNETQNYYLRLDQEYDGLIAGFATDTAARIAAADEDLLPTMSLKPERIAELYQKLHGTGSKASENFHGIQRIMWNALHRGWGFAGGITNQAGDLLAATFWLYSHGRAVNLLSIETKEGQAKQAMLMLYDGLIQRHAGQTLVLDFNGNTALAQAFGAQAMPSIRVKKSHLLYGLL